MEVKKNRGLRAWGFSSKGGRARAGRQWRRAGPGVKAACERGCDCPVDVSPCLRIIGLESLVYAQREACAASVSDTGRLEADSPLRRR